MKTVYENVNDDTIYNQLDEMIKEFVKVTAPKLASGEKDKQFIERGEKSYLGLLKKARDINSGCKVFYIICDNKVVGFEIAEVGFNRRERAVIGYKPGAYIKEEYKGKQIDGKFIASLLDNAVEQWFREENVTVERINTLESNEKHLKVYKRMGYNEISRNNGTVFLEKRIPHEQHHGGDNKTTSFEKLGKRVLEYVRQKCKSKVFPMSDSMNRE